MDDPPGPRLANDDSFHWSPSTVRLLGVGDQFHHESLQKESLRPAARPIRWFPAVCVEAAPVQAKLSHTKDHETAESRREHAQLSDVGLAEYFHW